MRLGLLRSKWLGWHHTYSSHCLKLWDIQQPLSSTVVRLHENWGGTTYTAAIAENAGAIAGKLCSQLDTSENYCRNTCRCDCRKPVEAEHIQPRLQTTVVAGHVQLRWQENAVAGHVQMRLQKHAVAAHAKLRLLVPAHNAEQPGLVISQPRFHIQHSRRHDFTWVAHAPWPNMRLNNTQKDTTHKV